MAKRVWWVAREVDHDVRISSRDLPASLEAGCAGCAGCEVCWLAGCWVVVLPNKEAPAAGAAAAGLSVEGVSAGLAALVAPPPKRPEPVVAPEVAVLVAG